MFQSIFISLLTFLIISTLGLFEVGWREFQRIRAGIRRSKTNALTSIKISKQTLVTSAIKGGVSAVLALALYHAIVIMH